MNVVEHDNVEPYTPKNEREFQRRIIAEAKKRGWFKIHQEGNSFGSRPGWPDLTLVHGGEMVDVVVNDKKVKRWLPTDGHSLGCLFLELKVGKRTVTPQQQEWIDVLQYAGLKAYVMRPADLPNIIRLLDGLEPIYGVADDTEQLELM